MKAGVGRWKGPTVNMQTQEEYSVGTLTTISDNFRVYSSMEEGVQGYFEFLFSGISRYDNLK
jgi:flagellum-specific peptidoglycan hydrolase FlgJ